MADRAEALDRLPADPLRGAVGADQLGVLLLQPLQALQQAVELAVADRGRGLDVVEVVVALDLLAQRFDFRARRSGHDEPLPISPSRSGRRPGPSDPQPHRLSPCK